jgi:nucleotide-binding universal stress UspA family protein
MESKNMAIEIRNILFATDFSENAKQALPIAAKIASLTESKLILFHAVQVDMYYAPDFRQDQEKASNKAHRQFDKLLGDLKNDDQYKDIELSRVLETEQPSAGILDISSEYNIDLIVMGTKGAGGNREAIFGSTISSIIKNSDVPVLGVPPGGSLEDLAHIAFTTDYHEGDWQALQQTIAFAKLFDATIDIIHVAEEESLLTDLKFRGFRDLVKEQSDYEKISFEIKHDHDFFPAMADYFTERPHSLLVMVRYKKTIWEELVEKDHSKQMAFYTKVPLLVLIGGRKAKNKTRNEGRIARFYSKK